MTNTELADELMAMAPTVAAATAEGGAAVLREAASRLRFVTDDLVWLRANFAGGSTAEINRRIEAAISGERP